MSDLDPAILNLLEDIEMARIAAGRSGAGLDVPLAQIAANSESIGMTGKFGHHFRVAA